MKTDKLTRRNFLKNIGLAGVVGIGVNGCGSDKEYHFDGIIDGEQVRFYETDIFDLQNNLEVVRKDSTKIRYNSLYCIGAELRYITINKDGKTITYQHDKIGKPILKEAQKQYTNYLEKILEHKKQEGLNLIK